MRTLSPDTPRDLVGYGRNSPDPKWPSGTSVAVQFVINYEEGGESSILDGDAASENLLSEIGGAAAWPGQRNLNMESIYEYGSRAGFWRLFRLFTETKMQCTVYGMTLAMARNPEEVPAMKEAGWEIASHGYRWLEYKDFPIDREREHILEAVRLHAELTGERPHGMYQGKPSDNTLKLVMEEGGFLYSSDSYANKEVEHERIRNAGSRSGPGAGRWTALSATKHGTWFDIFVSALGTKPGFLHEVDGEVWRQDPA